MFKTFSPFPCVTERKAYHVHYIGKWYREIFLYFFLLLFCRLNYFCNLAEPIGHKTILIP